MRNQKETVRFDAFNEAMVESLISHLYKNRNEDVEVFFDGIGLLLESTLNDLAYNEEMQKVFDRVAPGMDFQKNSAQFTACINLKKCALSDATKLIGHYYNSYIYVPKKDISCSEFALEFKEKDNLKNFLRTARYKSMIERDYHVEPGHASFVVRGTGVSAFDTFLPK